MADGKSLGIHVQDFYDTVAVDHMRKDLKIAIEEAKENNAKIEITEIIDNYKDIQTWAEIDGTLQAY